MTPTATRAPTGSGHRLLLAVLATTMLIDAIEVSAVLVAVPAIGADLGLAPVVAQGTVGAFALGFGATLVVGSRVVARYGRRRVYTGALLVFALASLVAGLATDPVLLLTTRLAKGACAALTAPTGLAIVAGVFPEGWPRRRATGVYTLCGAGGFTGGLLLSGVLTAVDWRWTLAFPAPVALVLFLLGLRVIPPDPPGERPRLGGPGAPLLVATLVAPCVAVPAVAALGWADPRAVTAVLAAVALPAVLVAVERRSSDPLLPRRVVTDASLVRSALGAATLNGSHVGLLFRVSEQMQPGNGPLVTALAFLPASVPLLVTALLSGRLVERFGTRRLIVAGALAPLLGYVLYLRPGTPGPYATGLLPTLLLVGTGFVCAFTAYNVQAMSGLPPADRPAAGAIYQTAVQMGAAVTVALVAALMPDPLAPVLLIVGVGLLGLVAALVPIHGRKDA